MVTLSPAVLVLVLAATPAHPLHTTLTTVEWHGDRHELDVAVRVFTQDVSDALTRTGTILSDSAACRYATRMLSIGDETGMSLPIARCVAERTADVTWIRLFLPTRSPAGLRIRNALLFECFPDQVNIVQALLGGSPRTILFTSGDGPKALS